MGKKYLIDTNVIIGYLDNKLNQSGMDFMHAIIDETPNISVINQIEILRFNTTSDVYTILTDFIKVCTILQLNQLVIDKTIEICKASKIKLPDAVIGATAVVNNLILLTRNVTDFNKIESLELVNPWDLAK